MVQRLPASHLTLAGEGAGDRSGAGERAASGRFAVHKLWTSRTRPATFRAKARTDLLQAEKVLEVLAVRIRDIVGE